MHTLGVRAVRVNFRSSGKRPDAGSIFHILTTHADRIRPFGWHIQVYCYFDQITLLAPAVDSLGTQVIIDHIGSPELGVSPFAQDGFQALVSLLRGGKAWVKLSGVYRLKAPQLDLFIREMLSEFPDKLVFASDWPHTGGAEHNPGGDRRAPQPYRKVDDAAFVEQCRAWCSYDEVAIQKLFVDNPAQLWQ